MSKEMFPQEQHLNEINLTIESTDVLHCDFTVAPNGADDRVQLLALEGPEGNSEVLPVNDER